MQNEAVCDYHFLKFSNTKRVKRASSCRYFTSITKIRQYSLYLACWHVYCIVSGVHSISTKEQVMKKCKCDGSGIIHIKGGGARCSCVKVKKNKKEQG